MSASKAKGSAWERAIALWLASQGVLVERRIAGSVLDRGDIGGIKGLVIEAKNHARLDLPKWVSELETEITNEREHLDRKGFPTWTTGAVWVKKKGKSSAGDGYIVMSPALWLELLRNAGKLDG